MKIETTPQENHQVKLIVTLDASQMESAKRRAARKISEQKSVPGFRPGKAPYDVIVRSFGESVITEQAVDILLDEVYPKVLEEAQIDPGGPGSVEKVDNIEKAPEFTFLVPLAPTVTLGDYRSIRIPYTWIEPGEEDVDTALQEMRRMYAKTESVDRPIQSGDFVLVDLRGIKSKSEEGEPAVVERIGFPVFIRSDDKKDEWPFPGFSNELIGVVANESKKITHRYPKDHPDEAFTGKSISFDVLVKMVRGSTLPDLNDEFAKQLGPFENLQALRDSLKADLSSRSKAEYDDDYYGKVIETIKADAVIKYSTQAVDHEVGHVVEELKTRLAKQNMDLPTYLKTREMDEEKFIAEEARPVAVKRLERSLLLDELSKQEKVEVSKEMLDSSFQQTLYEMSGNESFNKYMKGKSKPPRQLIEALTMESANRAFLQQTFTRMKAIATGELALADESSAGKINAIDDNSKKTREKPAPKKKSQRKQVQAEE